MLPTEQLLQTLTPCMRLAGITRVTNITGLDDVGVPVALAVRPNSRSLSVSQGKGTDMVTAKLSAVMEALEHYHAERVAGPIWLERYSSMVQERAVVSIERLPRTSRRFDPHARIPWINAKSLLQDRDLAVPLGLVHLDFTLPLPEGSGYFPLSSNGLGAGFSRDAALLHGLLELIERDSLALFYERDPEAQAARRIRVDTVKDDVCTSLLQQLEAADLGVAIWDLTTDVGIATCLCSIGERNFNALRPVGIARGYGCHPHRAVALRRAITEAAQSRLTRIAGSRDDMQPSELSSIRSAESVQHQRDHVNQESCAVHKLTDVPSFEADSFREQLEYVASHVARAGMEDVLYVELSRSEFPITVVRVLVPGLEGFPDDPGYVPGARACALRNGAEI